MSVLLSLKIYIKVAEIQSLLDEPEPTAKNFSDIYPYAFAVGLNTVWADKFAGQPAIWQISKTEELSWYGGGETSFLNIYFENHLSSFENRSSATEKYSPPSESASGDGGGW